MLLGRFMKGVVTADLDETAVSVARKMAAAHVGSVIVTRGEHPVGIITDRDLALRVVSEGRDPARTRASDIVTYDVTTISSSDGIDTAVRVMRERGVRRVPIVDDAGRVAGVVTADDLVVLMAARLSDLGACIGDNVDAGDSR